MTAHPQEPHDDEVNYFEAAPRRGGRVRKAFKPVVQVGWNIAALVFGGKIREARDIAMFNDHEATVAFAIKHQKAIGTKIQEMLNCPPP